MTVSSSEMIIEQERLLPLHRRRHRHSQIDDLPAHLLTHIVSFLPTKDAVRTASISRSWRHLWTDLPRLDLDVAAFFTDAETELADHRNISSRYFEYMMSEPPPPQFISSKAFSETRYGLSIDFAAARFALFADSVLHRLHLHLRRVRHIRIRFYSDHGALLRPCVDRWIRLAMSSAGGVETLHLDFAKKHGYVTKREIYVLARRVGAAAAPESLVSLRLSVCKFVPAAFGTFPSLKSLVLSEVSLPRGSIGAIIAKCPLLEHLSMERCVFRETLTIRAPGLGLKSLELVHCCFAFGVVLFEIRAPELSWFKFCGGIGPVCSVSGFSGPITAEVRAFCSSQIQAGWIVSLLKDLSSASSLSLSYYTVQGISAANDTITCLPNLKHLKLSLSIFKNEYPGLTSLLQNSPNLESLSINIWPHHCKDQWTEGLDMFMFDEENYWESQVSPVHCLVHHLKRVDINYYMVTENQLKFLAFLLKNSTVLQEMKIIAALEMMSRFKHISQEDAQNEFNFFSETLSTLPRASQEMDISVDCNKDLDLQYLMKVSI